MLFYFVISILLSQVQGGRIIGGTDAFAGEYPFAVAINVQTFDSIFFCGGSLANEYWVLTSAQCVFRGMLFVIHLGSNLLNSTESTSVTVSTDMHATHPNYHPNVIDYDLGLIRLREPITFTDYIQPVLMPDSELINNDIVRALGWGQTSDATSGLSNTLKYIEASVLSNQECRLTYGNAVTDSMVCVAGNYNEGTCIGDIGGPLIQCENSRCWIVGIATFLSGNGCESTDPSGFTRIYPHLSWIMNMLYPA